MGLLKNRIRTIVGEETDWLTATARLLFYVFQPARYRNKIRSLLRKVLHPSPSYQKWLQKHEHELANVSSHHIKVQFIILSRKDPKQTYPSVIWLQPEDQIPNQQDAYLLKLQDEAILHPNACMVLANAIGDNRPDILTFDSDEQIDGVRQNPRFMPSWSPVRLWFDNYLRGAVCVRLQTIKPYYHKHDWYNCLRTLGQQSLQTQRVCSVLLTVSPSLKPPSLPIVNPSSTPLVSIIIPTRNKAALVQQCIDSIIAKSTYPNYEIVLVDNNSDDPELEALCTSYQQRLSHRFCWVKAAYQFNFSQLINDGAAHSKGAYLILLNNDTEIVAGDWIEQLLLVASHPLAGAVGAKLLYPDDTIQHAGIVLSKDRISRHIYLGKNQNEMVYDDALNSVVEYSALTAACLLVSKSNFEKVGGFNIQYKVEYNDLDFCLRLQAQGLHNVFAPQVVLYHYESASRQHPMSSRQSANQHYNEKSLMVSEWLPVITQDPYHHPNRELFGLE